MGRMSNLGGKIIRRLKNYTEYLENKNNPGIRQPISETEKARRKKLKKISKASRKRNRE